MSEENWDLPESPPNDFDFVEAYDDEPSIDEKMLEENTAASAINCAFIGIGGGGGKLAKAFMDLGFNKTLLVNTTEKDQPSGVNPENFILIPGADGVGKDVKLGKEILANNSALVEDALRTRVGKVDWVFVCAGAGGGTGSASHVLHKAISRYLSSSGASGKVVYIVSTPSSQELLNPTIKSNCEMLLRDINKHTRIVIDNEKQLQLLRGKVGMLNMYPAANKNFAKLLTQILKLANEPSPIQAFDSKDLERCLNTPGRILLGSTVVRDPSKTDLGSLIFQGCLKSSPCPTPATKSKTGALLLIATPEMADDPAVSNRLEAAFSYVGGRADTLFSGVYVRSELPGLIALTLLGGM
jgi:cell division GTPase FtsZ